MELAERYNVGVIALFIEKPEHRHLLGGGRCTFRHGWRLKYYRATDDFRKPRDDLGFAQFITGEFKRFADVLLRVGESQRREGPDVIHCDQLHALIGP